MRFEALRRAKEESYALLSNLAMLVRVSRVMGPNGTSLQQARRSCDAKLGNSFPRPRTFPLLLASLTAQNRSDCLQHNLEIEQQRKMLNVVQVILQFFHRVLH
jgi:hypothetical protein